MKRTFFALCGVLLSIASMVLAMEEEDLGGQAQPLVQVQHQGEVQQLLCVVQLTPDQSLFADMRQGRLFLVDRARQNLVSIDLPGFHPILGNPTLGRSLSVNPMLELLVNPLPFVGYQRKDSYVAWINSAERRIFDEGFARVRKNIREIHAGGMLVVGGAPAVTEPEQMALYMSAGVRAQEAMGFEMRY